MVQAVEGAAIVGELLSPISSGPVGRWDRGSGFECKLYSGALQAISDVDLLSGQNLLAVRCDNDFWELLQFGSADLIGLNTYRLSHLLRAQLGTEDAMQAGAVTGARAVLLNGSVERLEIDAGELGLELTYRTGSASLGVGDAAFDQSPFTARGRGLRPLSPVHVRAKRLASGDITITWLRRTRIDGDPWELVDVPLGEDFESYRTDILNGQTVLRQMQTTNPELLYTLVDQISDFGQAPSQLDLSVQQISATYGAGTPAKVILNVQ